MRLSRGDIQGNVVRGYKHMHHSAYLFWRIERPAGAQQLLRELCAESAVRSDEHWSSKSAVHEALNIAFTYSGLEKLGCAESFDRFADFRQGMRRRAPAELRDTGANHPDHWRPELRNGADLLFTIYADRPELRDDLIGSLRARCARSGLAEVVCQVADVLPGEREHLRFADGFSQPALRASAKGSDDDEGSPRREGALPRAGLLNWRPGWRAIRLGEILLGHEDEDGMKAGGGDRHGVLRNGTFMVWRKLEQDVDHVERFFEQASNSEQQQRWLEAKVVGRWRNGASLITAPYAQPPDDASPKRPSNDFDYSDDPRGARCPVGAHVRRANPRTSLKWGTERTKRHRIVRRGMPYDERNADGGRGLIFVCFNASIERQFELIQGRWLMDGDAFGLGGDQDFLLGHDDPRGKITIQGDRSRPAIFLRRPDRPFVRTLGGYYLFVPGISALSSIAAGPGRGSRLRLAARRVWQWLGGALGRRS